MKIVSMKIVSATFPQSVGGSEAAALRANLEVCWRMARNAPNQDEKRSWLDMAEAWRLLILTRGEEFEVAAPRHGKGELELGDLIRHFCSHLLAL
jgi:hypothetical protein